MKLENYWTKIHFKKEFLRFLFPKYLLLFKWNFCRRQCFVHHSYGRRKKKLKLCINVNILFSLRIYEWNAWLMLVEVKHRIILFRHGIYVALCWCALSLSLFCGLCIFWYKLKIICITAMCMVNRKGQTSNNSLELCSRVLCACVS